MQTRNKNKLIEINSEIIEYDIKSANISICREYNLLSDNILDELSKMRKDDRVVTFGKILRKEKELSKVFNSKFDEVVKTFLQNNSISENNIISIKKDAVFVQDYNIKNRKVGNHITFEKKNTYHAYLYLEPFEFYFGKDKVDVKGLNDDLLSKHKSGILDIMETFIEVCESSRMNKKDMNIFARDLVNLYKNKKLDINSYREFNSYSAFKVNMGGGDFIYMEDIDYDTLLQSTDISYNYMHIVLPLYRNIIF